MLSQSRIEAIKRAAFNHGEKQGMEKGMTQGMAQGMNTAKEVFAKRLEEAGFSPEQIEELTALQ